MWSRYRSRRREAALVVDGVPFVVGRILENEALFLEAAADELVKGFEPILELGVTISVFIDVVE